MPQSFPFPSPRASSIDRLTTDQSFEMIANEKPDVQKRMYLECQIAKLGDVVDFLMADGTRFRVTVENLLPIEIE